MHSSPTMAPPGAPRSSAGGARLLFLSRWCPHPADNGIKLRNRALLRALTSHFQVDLLSFVDGDPAAVDREALRAATGVAELALLPARPFRPGSLRALAGFLRPEPRFLFDTHSPAFLAEARAMAARNAYGLVLASMIDMMPYALALEGPRLLDDVELHALQQQVAGAATAQARLRARLMWWKLTRYLRTRLPHFAAATVVSEGERRLLQRLAPGYRHVALLENGVDLSAPMTGVTPQPDTLIYSGAVTYGANFDAVHFFVDQILPRIRARRPAVTLTVTGATAGVDLTPLQRPGVRFSGYLPTVAPAVAASWVAVVPLRQGSGTRLKILESLALGTPVVSTTKGAEGLDLQDGRDLLLADAPDAFAAAVCRLLEDPALRRRLATQGRATTAARYDWAAIGDRLRGLVADALAVAA